MNGKWIWYYGEYEIFHTLSLHSRRQEYGADYPAMWSLPNVYPIVNFEKTVELDSPTEFTVKPNGVGFVMIDNERFPTSEPIICPNGKHHIFVKVTNYRGLPAIYVSGEKIYSDGTWVARHALGTEKPVGCVPEYLSESDNVEEFPFSYERIYPVSSEKTENGYLYDFGRETFGYLYVEGKAENALVSYGESAEEALAGDATNVADKPLVFETVTFDGTVKLRQRAFRYIHISSENEPKAVYADYEYLPLTDKGAFSCDDPMIKKIYDTCAYTFHLNSREFYLDGIKRDRWVWSGDAYQSFMINRYLYADPEITKRTILALLGKPPYYEHINTINDYSFYLIISVYDYWFDTADSDFVSKVYKNLYELYKFCVSRLDENGFVCEKTGDWIFIDWNESLDKVGPICAEQILLWQATKCIKKLAEIVEEEIPSEIDENELREQIYRFYYKKELGGFIDSYASGKNNISRHQNIFALLYGFATEEECKVIMQRILCNPAVPAITTPYFELYELLAMCKYGNVRYATGMLTSYWGKMLSLGATSIWEEFDPQKAGAEHYAMYGHRFGKSLCHAWGCGPVCILGKYVAGVSITSPGGKTFEVRPRTDIYRSFEATVPVANGTVNLTLDNGKITVLSDVTGGKLCLGEKTYDIEKGKTLTAF